MAFKNKACLYARFVVCLFIVCFFFSSLKEKYKEFGIIHYCFATVWDYSLLFRYCYLGLFTIVLNV